MINFYYIINYFKYFFSGLLSEQDDEFNETRRANVFAVYASIEAKKAKNNEISTFAKLPFEQESFEQLYNNASLLVYQSNYNEAIKILDRASGFKLNNF